MADTPDIDGGDNAHTVAKDELRNFVNRMENLIEEKATIGEDIKELKGEIKRRGYDNKVIAEILKLRKMEADERANWEALRHTYGEALGIFG